MSMFNFFLKREDGRQPILMFMEKPSKKLYPDYFQVRIEISLPELCLPTCLHQCHNVFLWLQVITDPIDMLTIEANIKSDKYTSEEEIIADFKVRNLL